MTTCDHHGQPITTVAFVCHCNQPCCYNPRNGCTCPACNCDDHHQVRGTANGPKRLRRNFNTARWV